MLVSEAERYGLESKYVTRKMCGSDVELMSFRQLRSKWLR